MTSQLGVQLDAYVALLLVLARDSGSDLQPCPQENSWQCRRGTTSRRPVEVTDGQPGGFLSELLPVASVDPEATSRARLDFSAAADSTSSVASLGMTHVTHPMHRPARGMHTSPLASEQHETPAASSVYPLATTHTSPPNSLCSRWDAPHFSTARRDRLGRAVRARRSDAG